MLVRSIDELYTAIPDFIIKSNGEYASACPFCGERVANPNHVNSNGIKFAGTNRFIKLPNKDLFYCRYCRQEGRGRNGTFSFREVTEMLGLHISRELEAASFQIERDSKIISNVDFAEDVQRWHKDVVRKYWHAIGISDETIDRWQLGYTKPQDRLEFGHITPMRLVNIVTGHLLTIGGGKIKEYEAYGCEYRQVLPKPSPISKTQKPQFLFSGDVKRHGWAWIEQTDKTDGTMIITEGSKDALSAFEIGFGNFAASFGVDHFTRKHYEYIKSLGIQQVIIAGDDDEPGKKFSETGYYHCHSLGLAVAVVDWSKIVHKGNDLNDLLVQYGVDAKSKVLDSLIVLDIDLVKAASLEVNTAPKRRLSRFEVEQDDMGIIEEDEYVPVVTPSEITSLTNLRSEKEGSLYHRIQEFTDNYRTYQGKRGALLYISVPPGAGKTLTTSRIAQQIIDREKVRIREQLKELNEQAAALLKEANDVRAEDPIKAELLESEVGTLQRKIATYSRITVAWYGPFKAGYEDIQRFPAVIKEDWFDFEARTEENCRNYDTVRAMSDGRHQIMKYCQTSCQFRQNCAYMKQRELQDVHPAVYYRHNHLMMESPSNLKLVVVDESPIHIIESSFIELSYGKMGYQELAELSPEQHAHVNEFVFALKLALKKNSAAKSKQPVFGVAAIALLEEAFKERQGDLGQWIALTDDELIEACEPNYADPEGTAPVPLRWVADVMKAFILEYPEYREDPQRHRNSFIHFEGGKIIVMPYEIEKFRNIPRNVPIICLDATGMSPLLEAIFDRDIIEFSPAIRSKELQTTMVVGSDYTKSYVHTEILKLRKLEMAEGLLTDDYKDISIFKAVNDKSPTFRDIYDLLRIVSRKHGKVLFVTYKELADFLRQRLHGIGELGVDTSRLTVAHYGSLRGTNKYEDYDTAVLFGAYRVPYDIVWRNAMIWSRFLGNVDNLLSPEVVAKKAFYPNTNEGSEIWTFIDQFTQQYATMVEVGEMRQCADRIRPHNGGEKHIYAVMNRPSVPYVDEVISYSAFLQKWRDNLFVKEEDVPEWLDRLLYDAIIQDYEHTGAFPNHKYVEQLLRKPIPRREFDKTREYVKERKNVRKPLQ